MRDGTAPVVELPNSQARLALLQVASRLVSAELRRLLEERRGVRNPSRTHAPRSATRPAPGPPVNATSSGLRRWVWWPG